QHRDVQSVHHRLRRRHLAAHAPARPAASVPLAARSALPAVRDRALGLPLDGRARSVHVAAVRGMARDRDGGLLRLRLPHERPEDYVRTAAVSTRIRISALVASAAASYP